MKHKRHSNRVTTVTFLTRQEIDFLDRMGKDCFFKYGHKLSRAEILSQLVDLLMHLGIKVEDLNLEDNSLWEALMEATKNGHKNIH